MGESGRVGEEDSGMPIHQTPNPDSDRRRSPRKAPDLFITVHMHMAWKSPPQRGVAVFL